MVKNIRVTYTRRHSYATKGNRTRVVKTPGGRLVSHVIGKPASGPKCGDCGIRIQGVPALRPKQYTRIAKSSRSVSRAYGGSRCSKCVRDRIVRAFLIEEQKIVKKLLLEQLKKAKSSK